MTLARTEGVTAERSGDRTVVLDAAGVTLITLNAVGTMVWERLPCDRDGLLDHLSENFPDVDVPILEADLDFFLAELVSGTLITEIDATS